MHTRFTAITNELKCLREPISQSKQVKKILKFYPNPGKDSQVLPKSGESKVDDITEAKDLKTFTMDVPIGNLETHKLNKQHDSTKRVNKKDKSCL